MAINPYFKFHQNTSFRETEILHALTTEVVQQTGMDVYYLPRTHQKFDAIFGEDVLSAFKSHFVIELYLANTSGYDGNDILASFGFQAKDEATFQVPARRFTQVTGFVKPREGDLIYMPMAKTLFEIKYCEDEAAFFPHAQIPYYEIRVEAFNFTHEEVETGHTEIDEFAPMYDTIEGGVDPFDVSTQIEAEADAIVDFSEENPFGSF